MKTSDKGVAFLAIHEGRVHKAYKDSVGVLTIGVGFTMRSRVFAQYWRSTKGHDLRSGDTITDAECDALLKTLLDEEYTPTIDAKARPTQQHQFDACASISYNAGPGSLNDGWAKKLAAGDVRGAAAAIRVYKLTHGILKGRRADEARLLETGDYGKIGTHVIGAPDAPSVSKTAADVMVYQKQLATLGFYKDAIDGIPGGLTKAAILAYQKQHADLVDDGIVGPATRASLERDTAAKTATLPVATPSQKAATGGAGAVIIGAGAAAASTGHPWLWIAVGAAALIIGAFVYVIIKARGKP